MRLPSRSVLLLAIPALAFLSAAPARGQQATVTFTVFAGESQAPLPGARVLVDGSARGVADARGVVRVNGLAPGAHGVRVELLDRIPRGMRLELVAG
ncbi:MAG TPA: hypothetical protein VF541_17640, partial [Longimicrobium sp.]